MSIYRRFGKRAFDLALTVPGLLLLSPLLLLVAALVRIKLGAPVLFRQDRPGKDEKLFKMFKFRTMTNARDAQGNLLSDGERLTPFGAKLRATSLDELPELLNVLRGDMSLVGPRPLLTRYTPYFTDSERIRFTLRPGITGWAQVNGRNDLPWDERIAYDVDYAAKIGFWMDVKILFMTVAKVLRRDGLRVDPGAHLQDFDVYRQSKLGKGGSAL